MENVAYRKFMEKAQLDKSVNSLIGLIEGIIIDTRINHDEVRFLQMWLEEHRFRANKHPLNELFPVVEQALADGVLTQDEKDDIIWLCEKLTSVQYYNKTTSDMQKLHALLAGVRSDGEINIEELEGISSWLCHHRDLRHCWPYDEIESIVTDVISDKVIDADEHKMLMSFLGEFASTLCSSFTTTNDKSDIVGICAVCPEITFRESTFCLTGKSHKYDRVKFQNVISHLGGLTTESMSKHVNYLVVGSAGNPYWAYACYGRKVEKAVALKKHGYAIVIVHENDFHDAVDNLP